MSKIMRSWKVNGQVFTENEVEIVDIDWYLRGDLLSPLEELFRGMGDSDGNYGSQFGSAGRIGSIVIRNAQDRMEQVFNTLREQNTDMEVILASRKTIGVPRGTLIAVEFRQQMEEKP